MRAVRGSGLLNLGGERPTLHQAQPLHPTAHDLRELTPSCSPSFFLSPFASSQQPSLPSLVTEAVESPICDAGRRYLGSLDIGSNQYFTPPLLPVLTRGGMDCGSGLLSASEGGRWLWWLPGGRNQRRIRSLCGRRERN